MSEEKILFISFVYILLNLVLFILYKFTKRLKILHKVMSVIDNLIFILFLGYGFYRANPLLVILVPCVLLIVYPVTWGLNKEISDEELFLFSRRRYLYWNEFNKKITVEIHHFMTFPFYYLLDSWKKSSD